MEATQGPPIPSTPASPATPGVGDQGMGSSSPGTQSPPAAPATPATPMITAQRGHFFSGVDWTDVLMMGIVVFTLGLSIYASRQQILFVRSGKKTILQDIDEIKSNLQSVMGDQYQPYST